MTLHDLQLHKALLHPNTSICGTSYCVVNTQDGNQTCRGWLATNSAVQGGCLTRVSCWRSLDAAITAPSLPTAPGSPDGGSRAWSGRVQGASLSDLPPRKTAAAAAPTPAVARNRPRHELLLGGLSLGAGGSVRTALLLARDRVCWPDCMHMLRSWRWWYRLRTSRVPMRRDRSAASSSALTAVIRLRCKPKTVHRLSITSDKADCLQCWVATSAKAPSAASAWACSYQMSSHVYACG